MKEIAYQGVFVPEPSNQHHIIFKFLSHMWSTFKVSAWINLKWLNYVIIISSIIFASPTSYRLESCCCHCLYWVPIIHMYINTKQESRTENRFFFFSLPNLITILIIHSVAQAYVNQKKLDTETRILQANAAQFSKQTMQWLKLVEDFNTALKVR